MPRIAFLCTLLFGLCVAILAQEFRIAAGDGWIPFTPSRDVEAGSALDFSKIVPRDAPAGKFGFVRAVGGHFKFEGRPGVPQRFLGANLCLEANYPRTDAEADRLVERLVRCGYNSVRLHHHDGAWVKDFSATKNTKEHKDSSNSNFVNSVFFVAKGNNSGENVFAPSAAPRKDSSIDRLDRFLAKAFAAGIYVTTDLYVSRKVSWRDIGVDRDGAEGLDYKTMLFVHDGAFENWKDFVRAFLTHRNPYTGRTYAEEPGIACLCLVNENSIQQGIRDKTENPYLKDAWRQWFLARRAEAPGCWPSLSPDEIPAKGGGWSISPILPGEAWDAMSRFCADLERRMVARMRGFLREELGVRIPITDQNWGTQAGPMQEARAELYDYADAHTYVDHPEFPETWWRLPSTLKNENRLANDGFGFDISWRRTFGQPFTVSEWNFCGPGRHRSMAGLYMGALAALQDWSALWRFSFSHWYRAYDDTPEHIGYFDIVNDPAGLVSERLAAALFLRGDLAPLADAAATVLTEESVRPPSRDHAFNVLPRWWRRQLDFRVGTALPGRIPEGVAAVPMEAAAQEGAEPPVSGGSPAVSHDPARGTMSVVTPRTCALYASGEGVFRAGPLSVENHGGAATVWVSSLDGRPLETSARMLFVRLGDIQGDGARYADASRRKLLDWGSTPCMEAGNSVASVQMLPVDSSQFPIGECDLGIGNIGNTGNNPFKVFALSASGARRAEIPCRVEGGALRFTADNARDPAEATFLYEIARGAPSAAVEAAWTGEPPQTLADGRPAPPFADMAARSVFVPGDFARFEHVWERLERGGSARIAVIGGSITAGAGAMSVGRRWANIFCENWRRAFPDAEISLINAGIGATGSDIGTFRVKRDVLAKSPDVVVVEFAANDFDNRENAETFEGVVRQLLADPRGIAVIVLGMAGQSMGNAQRTEGEVARHYGLPFVSWRDALRPCMDAGTLRWADVSPDTIHPNDIGHAWAAALLGHHLARNHAAWKASGRPPAPIPPMPSPLYGTRYDDGEFIRMENAKVVENDGFFPLRDWCWGEGLACTNAGGRIVFEVEGATVALLYRIGREPFNWGRIDVSIDGRPVVSGLDCFRDQVWWYTPSVFLCRDEPGQHRVEIVTLPSKNEASNGYGCHLTGFLVSGLSRAAD